MNKEKIEDPDTVKYAVIISGNDNDEDKRGISSAIFAIIHKYNAHIVNTAHEKFGGKILTYIIIDTSALIISIGEFSNRLWIAGNDLNHKTFLKKEDIYLMWVRESISIL